MPDVPKHAWTHRPRSQGGTDPLPVTPNLLPTIYTSSTDHHDIVAGEVYGTGILWGTSAIVNGLADDMFHANEATDGTGDFYVYDGEVVQAYNEPKAVSYEFGVVLSGPDIDATAPNRLTMWLLLPSDLGGTNQEMIWEGDALAVKAAEGTPTFRMTGEAIMTGSLPFEGNALRNGNWAMGAIMQECGGAAGDQDVTVQSMWSRFTVLTHIEDRADYHA